MNGDGAALTILAIDDDADLLSSIVSYLEDIGFTVFQATGGREGIELFAKYQPDLVLTDLMMPDTDGLTVIRAIRAMNPDTPVVVISGNGSLHYAREAVKQGAWDYIAKPILDFAVIDKVVGQVLERTGRRQCWLRQHE